MDGYTLFDSGVLSHRVRTKPRVLIQTSVFLRKRGFDAWPSGRNDILVGGRKVYGSAFYSTGYRNVIHATLLCHEDIDTMQMALTPSGEKLRSKGISSVRQRVANLSEFGEADIGALRAALTEFFCDGETVLEEDDIVRIESPAYLDGNFIAGRKHWPQADDFPADAGIGLKAGKFQENLQDKSENCCIYGKSEENLSV